MEQSGLLKRMRAGQHSFSRDRAAGEHLTDGRCDFIDREILRPVSSGALTVFGIRKPVDQLATSFAPSKTRVGTRRLASFSGQKFF